MLTANLRASRPKSRQHLGVAVSVTFLLLGCSLAPAPTSPPSTDPPTPESTPAPIASPSPDVLDHDTLVLRIERTGGMVPPWERLIRYPDISVYGDGRVITLGPVDAMFPGPALPNLQMTRLSGVGLARLLDLAREAGLRGPGRVIGQPAPDAEATVFTVVGAEGRHETTAWRLSDEVSEEPAEAALRALLGRLFDLASWLQEGVDITARDIPYDWRALRIIAVPSAPEDSEEPDFVHVREWPLGPLASIGVVVDEEFGYRCAGIEGVDLERLRPEIAGANALTHWQSETETYLVHMRPLLPDEEACPGL